MTEPTGAVRVVVADGTPLISVASLATPSGIGRLRGIRSGEKLALYDDRPAAAYRLRRAVRANDLAVDQEYVVLPTWGRGTFLVEDAPGTMGWVWDTFATVPPGLSRGSLTVSLLVRLGRRFPQLLRLLGELAPGRLAVVRR